MKKKHWKSQFTSSLFVLPYLFLFVVFLLVPILYGIWISFHNWDLLAANHKFVGLQNYVDIFTSSTNIHKKFFQGMWSTIQFVIYSVPLLVILGLLFALLVNALPKRIQGLFRTIYFLPYAISVSVVAVIWLWILDTNSGLLNLLLHKPIPWLTELPYAWVALVLATIWWTIGFNMIIFINALNDVPEDMYEAASLDGANSWQKLIHITLPAIKPILIFVVITSTIASFNVYGQPFLMTRGGPGVATKVLLMNIVDTAFQDRQLGSASAMAILMSLIMIIISIIQFKATNLKKE
ncbi:sugar ABC transporter permease [Fodinisporobacter ferrooxydans]|uniref:Sugar ABC transporter permease n=1 Tax=Fodinisporobacter ferrooxydans TaxID=2901836 RepID=A0ABY4CJG2_9BACL|nr:sugar ABC transporter permease [Alicyclobacillaceae bacterium MYW30-H2]